ncbi:MAG: 6-phosphogluconolactonase [Verrucomicrobiota bacterium]
MSYRNSSQIATALNEKIQLVFPRITLWMLLMESLCLKNQDALFDHLIDRWSEIGGDALSQRGGFKVALTGSAFVTDFYRKLSKSEWPWSATPLFLTEENWVPRQHPHSHFQQVYQCFHPHRVTLHGWETENIDPDISCLRHEKHLLQQLSRPPRFDLVILTINQTNEIAGLFPTSSAWDETKDLSAPSENDRTRTLHLSLTPPLIRLAHHIWIIQEEMTVREDLRQVSPAVEKLCLDHASTTLFLFEAED